MEAVRQTSYGLDVNVMGNPVQETNNRTLKGRPIEEFMDELAKRLGKHYGLNDIREALVYEVEEDIVYVHRVMPQSMIIF